MPMIPIERIPVLKIPAGSGTNPPGRGLTAGSPSAFRPLPQILQQLGAQQPAGGPITLTPSVPAQSNHAYLQFWNAKWVDSVKGIAVLNAGGGLWICIRSLSGRYVIQCSMYSDASTTTYTVGEGAQPASIPVAKGQSLLCVFDLQPPTPSAQDQPNANSSDLGLHYIGISCAQTEFSFYSCDISLVSS